MERANGFDDVKEADMSFDTYKNVLLILY